MVPHHVFRAIHDQMAARFGVQLAGDQHGRHHVLERRDHDVQQTQGLGHGQGQLLVGEELHRDVHHPVR